MDRASMAESVMSERTHVELGLQGDQAVELYRLMLMTRSLDERIWALNRQGRVGITAPCRGHEASHIGCGKAFEPGRDVFLPYYRSLGVLVALGFSPRQLMLDVLGKADGPFSGGRQMPFHWTLPGLRVLSPSSSVATQIPHAVGAALACRQRGERAATLVTFGDGATSKSDFHAGLNFAAVWKLPVVFFCENNQYAISVPLSKQMPVQNVADRAVAYGMPGHVVDGNDVLAVYGATRSAVEHVLAGNGPVLLEAKTYRLMPHTSNDDDSTYRSQEEIDFWRARDPITRYQAYLREAGLLHDAADQALASQVAAEVDEATTLALQSPEPRSETALDHLYAPGTLNAPELDAARLVASDQVAAALRSEIGA
jgi:2-oxoisovalerate dehydrogenase E1 component alpha subunit